MRGVRQNVTRLGARGTFAGANARIRRIFSRSVRDTLLQDGLPMTRHSLASRLGLVAVLAIASGGATAAGVAACSSSTAAAGDSTAANGDAGTVVSGSGALTGTYGTEAVKPIVAAYWVGQPGDQSESGGGPFVYLFSTAVTCNDISKGSGWAPSLPAGTQALEMIIGVTATGTAANATAHAGAGISEVNFFTPTSAEARATAGNVTLTSYVKDVSVDGTVDATFPSGAAKGTFHATWCPGGHER
ncbi:MAG: hypothetical protein JWO86_4803 [Myxococcaceae bacterium]|nr:hypothetical protein [Myxococcaceae bacterium]